MFEKYKNADGKTYNGAAMLAELSGLSIEEIVWSFDRMKQLRQEGKTKEESIKIIGEEGKSKPWIK